MERAGAREGRSGAAPGRWRRAAGADTFAAMRRGVALALLLLLASPAGAQPLRARVDSIARAAMAAHRIPGMSIVVVRGGRTLVAAGYGTANLGTRAPATAATVYQIGSISKQFLAAAVLRLAERGTMALDAPVSRYLPAYRPTGDSVRVRDLLHQSSGVREAFTIPAYGEGIEDTTRRAEELPPILMREPLGFRPGARWSYSNSNYLLLAAAVERVAGRPYEDVLARELFAPLGLRTLRQCAPLPTGADEARGYVPSGDSVAPAPAENMRWIRGDGGLCASAGDLAAWARALAGGRVLRPASWRAMTTRVRMADGTRPDYGFALSLVPLDRAHPKVSHGGAMAGFSAALAHYPDDDLTIAVLTNRGGVWPEAIEQAIARAALGVPAPRVVDLPLPAGAAAYPGTYDIGPFALRIAARADGRLELRVPRPGPTSALLHQGGGRFVAESDPDAVAVTFAPRGLVLRMAGMHWYGVRVPE